MVGFQHFLMAGVQPSPLLLLSVSVSRAFLPAGAQVLVPYSLLLMFQILLGLPSLETKDLPSDLLEKGCKQTEAN